MRFTQASPLYVALGLTHLMSLLKAENAPPASGANGTDHIVNVAKTGLTFDPPNIKAKKGDTVTFIFFQGGHSVTQTHFANPCGGTKTLPAPICQPPALNTNVPPPIDTSTQSPYPTGPNPTDVSATNTTLPPLPNVNTPPPTLPTSDYPTNPPNNTIPNSPPPVNTPPPIDPSSFPTEGSGTQTPQTPANCTSSNITNTPLPDQSLPPPSPPPNTTEVSSVGTSTNAPPTCDSKCIEVTGSCQMSSDCSLQAQSPATTKCKVEEGVCKMCGNNADQNSSTNPSSPTEALTTTDPKISSGNLPQHQDGSVAHWRFRRNPESRSFTRRQVDFSSIAGEGAGGNNLQPAPNSTTAATSGQTLPNNTNPTTAPPDSSSEGGNGLDSGFVKVDDASKASGLRWTIAITDDSKPLWFMSAGQNDCTSGMVFAVNAPDSGNTFEQFASVAKTSTCSSAYPSCTKLSGQGTTAPSPPPKCASLQPPVPKGTIESSNPPLNVSAPPPAPSYTPPPPANTTAPPTEVSAVGSNPPPANPPAQPIEPPANVPKPPEGGNTTSEPSTNGTFSGTTTSHATVQVHTSHLLHVNVMLALLSLATLL